MEGVDHDETKKIKIEEPFIPSPPLTPASSISSITTTTTNEASLSSIKQDINNEDVDDKKTMIFNNSDLFNKYKHDNDIGKFHVLDEIKDTSSEKSYSSSYDDSDIPHDEIEQMLDEAFEREKYKKKRKAEEAGLDDKNIDYSSDNNKNNNNFNDNKNNLNNDKITYEEKDKVVLIEKCQNHFDVLPEGWIQVTHNSGMPLYLHKNSRVCTLAKPYFLGPGSVRKHEIPLSAIPCLSYRRALEKEEEEIKKLKEQQQQLLEQKKKYEQENGNADDNKKFLLLKQELPNARIETVKENIEASNLKPEDIRKYCEKLFKFKTIKVMRFKSWSERRQYTKRKKHEKQLQRPNLPAGTKLITFPIQHTVINNNDNNYHNNNGDNTISTTTTTRQSSSSSSSISTITTANVKKEWIMNPNGKSYVCILHEYVQHALKKQPTYKFTELENAATPYAATVSINDMQYGVGYGTSKKQAKSEAAKATLEILIPEVRSKITTDSKTGSSASKDQDQDLSFFDEIRIEDPRVAEFCAKTTEPSPHDILLTCLQRNFGLNDLQISYQGNTLKNKKNQFTMTVGKHTATVICKNKRDGKQRASQAILQALHPHITSWGSLLRLYGNGSVKSFKEKKLEEQEITLLQSKAAINSPNFAILDKLKLELSKLKEKRKAIKPIGVFIPNDNGRLPKLSCSNLKNVDL